ncbi:MAG: hypothetical protein JXB14_04170 [Candidatus Altiarchaeota archaeon]|nr:hypothetical protein [Candidatus Altiarchaeota archaeon]
MAKDQTLETYMDAKIGIVGIMIAVLLILPTTRAQISVGRSVAEEVVMGSPMLVELRIANDGNLTQEVTVEERIFIPADYMEPQAPKTKNWEGLSVEYLEWNISLEPGEAETLSYIIRPTTPGIFGFSPTIIHGQSVSYGEGDRILVRCVPDGKCDPGENFMNCEDCTTGREDGTCDYKDDGRCDPDCAEGYDPDCEAPKPPPSTTPPATPAKSREDTLIYVIVVVVIAALLVLALALLMVRKKKSKAAKGGNKTEPPN